MDFLVSAANVAADLKPSARTHMMTRHGRFAQQQILNERLYEKYTRIVITRSDYLWVVRPVSATVFIGLNKIAFQCIPSPISVLSHE